MGSPIAAELSNTEHLTSNRQTSDRQNSGRLIVITGPSGVGKGTLLQALLQRHPELKLSISATTRSARMGEVDGVNYYFITRQQFDLMVSEDEFIEWAEFANNCYGTPKRSVKEQLASGEWVILEIELEGARQVRQSFPEAYRSEERRVGKEC